MITSDYTYECRSGGKHVNKVLSFCNREGAFKTSFNKDNSANFSGEKKIDEAFRVNIFRAGEYAKKL